jgi:hypothetical protein
MARYLRPSARFLPSTACNAAWSSGHTHAHAGALELASKHRCQHSWGVITWALVARRWSGPCDDSADDEVHGLQHSLRALQQADAEGGPWRVLSSELLLQLEHRPRVAGDLNQLGASAFQLAHTQLLGCCTTVGTACSRSLQRSGNSAQEASHFTFTLRMIEDRRAPAWVISLSTTYREVPLSTPKYP